jgi:hypothetical protein
MFAPGRAGGKSVPSTSLFQQEARSIKVVPGAWQGCLARFAGGGCAGRIAALHSRIR